MKIPTRHPFGLELDLRLPERIGDEVGDSIALFELSGHAEEGRGLC